MESTTEAIRMMFLVVFVSLALVESMERTNERITRAFLRQNSHKDKGIRYKGYSEEVNSANDKGKENRHRPHLHRNKLGASAF